MATFLKINKSMQKLYFKVVAILDIVCEGLTFSFLISEMRIFDIDVTFVKLSLRWREVDIIQLLTSMR